jgi:hypothetical protein
MFKRSISIQNDNNFDFLFKAAMLKYRRIRRSDSKWNWCYPPVATCTVLSTLLIDCVLILTSRQASAVIESMLFL